MKKVDYLESIRLDGEEWRFICSEDYAVSSLGRVASFMKKQPAILKMVAQSVRNKEYLHVCIHSKKVRVHRLVATAYLPNPSGYNEIDHINNDPQDNRAVNLRWCTHETNMRNPLSRAKASLSRLEHPLERIDGYPKNVKLDRFFNRHEDKMKPIVQMKDGKEIARYYSLGDAERRGFKKVSISAAINGRLKTYRGCVWMLVSDYEKMRENQ